MSNQSKNPPPTWSWKASFFNLATTAAVYGPLAAAMRALDLLDLKSYTKFALVLSTSVVRDLMARGVDKKNAEMLARQVTLPRRDKSGNLIVVDGEFPFPLGALEALASIHDDKYAFEKLEMYLQGYPEHTLDKFHYMYVPFKYAQLDDKIRDEIQRNLANTKKLLQKRLSAYDLLEGPEELKEYALDTKAFPPNPFGHRKWIAFYAMRYKVRAAAKNNNNKNNTRNNATRRRK